MKLQSTTKIFSSLLILPVIVLFTSCKKQYTDYSYSNLVSFSLKGNDGEILKGAITAQDITVYWPPFTKVPDSIIPQITIAERASISPASDKRSLLRKQPNLQLPRKTVPRQFIHLNRSSISQFHIFPDSPLLIPMITME